MAFDKLTAWGREKGLPLLETLERIDQNPYASAIPHEVREEAKDFLYRGSQMFAPIGLTDGGIQRRAARRIEHFD